MPPCAQRPGLLQGAQGRGKRSGWRAVKVEGVLPNLKYPKNTKPQLEGIFYLGLVSSRKASVRGVTQFCGSAFLAFREIMVRAHFEGGWRSVYEPV